MKQKTRNSERLLFAAVSIFAVVAAVADGRDAVVAPTITLGGWRGETVSFRFDSVSAAGGAYAPQWKGVPGGWDAKAGETYLAYPDASPSLRFLELRNGIVAAEKIRILKEQGCLAEDFPALAAKFDRKRAMDNKSDFYMLRLKVQELVNRAK